MPPIPASVTIRDLHLACLLLEEVQRAGSGAYRRAAAVAGVRLSLIGESLDRVEAVLGHRLLQTGPAGRRRSVLTAVGDQFRCSAPQVVAAWDQAVAHVTEMVALERMEF